MKKITLDDSESRSADIVARNIDQLRELFPEAFTEGKIDFEVLRQLLGDQVDEREEKYGLNWHGKRAARRLALTPSTGTLRPCPEESVDWDTTKNLMIEGDNLEVLKLLQKSYAGKVKLIYIDPPYNKNGDFIYNDDFSDNLKKYLHLTQQVDHEGRVLSTSSETSGRYHTNWLTMMYPRLSLARDLLRCDGTVWVSIDDHELENLKTLCSLIFGPENFVATFIWEKRTTRENRAVFSVNHDYVVCFARNKADFESRRGLLQRTEANEERFANPDNDPRGPWQSVSLNAKAGPGRRREQFYTIVTPSGRAVDPPSGRCWLYTRDRFDELMADGRIWFGEDGGNVPREKMFRSESADGVVPGTMWFAGEVGTNDTAKKSLKALFDGVEVFDTPKPVPLLQRILEIGTASRTGDLIVDFFAGSASLGEAVFATNVQDGGNRQLVLVQWPEPLPEDAPGRHFGLQDLAAVGAERLRRAGGQLRQEAPLLSADLGFRVFKLDSSNLRAWDPAPADIEAATLDFVDHIKPGRSEADLLYEVLLKLGLDLCVPIERRSFAGKEVASVGGGSLFACFAPRLEADAVEAVGLGIVAWRDELAPEGEVTCVFRDSAFANDVAKTNLAAILEQHGITTVRSL